MSPSQAPSNRFVVGNPARDQYFYGRHSEVDMILAQPWSWLCGQRRMGKTSVLFRLEAEARRRDWIPLFLNLAHLMPQQASGRMLFGKVASSARRTLQDCGISASDFDGLPAEDAFKELTDRLLQPSPKRPCPRVLFLWDEAERLIDVEANDTGFLERLRASLETFSDVGFVLAATQLLSGLFGRTGHCSPFLTNFRWWPIGPLEECEAMALLRAEKTGGWPKPLPQDGLDEMVRWSGGHPYVLQEAGFQLEERFRRGQPPFGAAAWQDSVIANQMIRDAFKDDFAKLTITQQEVLLALCRAPGSLDCDELCRITDRTVQQVDDAADFLLNYGYVRRCGRGLELRFGFYRRLVTEPISTADPQKVARIARRTVFISYSHADAEWLARIRKFLQPAVTAGAIDDWSDEKIQPGTLWRAEVERALKDARVALLLISQDFINSKFVREIELPSLLAAAAGGTCRILCLHIRRSSLSGELPVGATQLRLLNEFQALNSPDKPLADLSEGAVDALLVHVGEELARAC
jgi:hypothetical protein